MQVEKKYRRKLSVSVYTVGLYTVKEAKVYFPPIPILK